MKDSCGLGGASEFLPGSAALGNFASPAALAPGGGSSGPLTPQPASPIAAALRKAADINVFELRKSAAMLKSLPNPVSPLLRAPVTEFLDLTAALFQPAKPLTRHFDDVLWRGSPIAGPAFHRILHRQHREYGFCDARLDLLHLFE
jgi:hypothetical protein